MIAEQRSEYPSPSRPARRNFNRSKILWYRTPPSRPFAKSHKKNPLANFSRFNWTNGLTISAERGSSYVSPALDLNLAPIFLWFLAVQAHFLANENRAPSSFLVHSFPCQTTSKTSGSPSSRPRAATVTMRSTPRSRCAGHSRSIRQPCHPQHVSPSSSAR